MKKKNTLLEQGGKLVMYTGPKGTVELRADTNKETIWASLDQIADLFDVQKSAISKHFKNIFESGELNKMATVSKMETVQIEGKRSISRQIEFYNLDAIIAVGYRVNSKKATKFRVWATKILKQYLIQGSVLDKKVILKNYDKFMESVSAIQDLLPSSVPIDPKSVLDLVKEYAVTWSKLDAYDREALSKKGVNKEKIKFTSEELMNAILSLREELIKKGEATDIFATHRRSDGVEGIVGDIMQSFGGSDLYPSLEEKAAHLLYFLIKDHPFVDGNKRSAAFSFIWFLRKNRIKGAKAINPSALTAIALLVAESDPAQKEKMVALVVELLKVK